MSLESKIQLLTSLGLIIGLVLVIWELGQTRDLTRAQLTSDTFDYSIQRHSAVMGESTARALAVACSNPEQLSLEQKIVLAEYYTSLIGQIRRSTLITQNSGISYQDQTQWEGGARWTFGMMLANDYGRWYWSTLAPFAPAEHRTLAEDAMSHQQGNCAEYYAGFDQWLIENGRR